MISFSRRFSRNTVNTIYNELTGNITINIDARPPSGPHHYHNVGIKMARVSVQ